MTGPGAEDDSRTITGRQDVTEIAIDDALSGEILSPDLAKVRETYGRFKLATVEFAEACYAAQQNGRSLRAIGDAAGCSHVTVKYVIDARVKSFNTGEPFSDVFTSITNTARKTDTSQPQLPESAPEIDPHWDEISDAEERGWGELDEEPDLGEELQAPQLEPAPHPTQPTPEQRERLDRLREMADEAERANPYVPIRELVDIRDALRRAIPKMRALKNAGQNVGADALTAGITSLCKELEELLCP